LERVALMISKSFLDGAQDVLSGPLFQGGLALMSGAGPQGMMRGMEYGNQYQQQKQRKRAFADLLQDPAMANLPGSIARIAEVAGPEEGLGLLAKQLDPLTELERRKSEADLRMQPLRERLLQAQISQTTKPDAPKVVEVDGRLVQVGPDGSAREIYQGPPDPIKEMIAKRLGGGQQPQAQPQPQVQPQSFSTPSADPLLRNIVENVAQPQPQAAPAMSAEPMVETPYGPMTRQQAQELGGTMLLDPRYQAAGKAILDSVQQGGAEWSKPVQNEIQTRQLNSSEGIARLRSIKERARPEFLTLEKNFGMAWNALRERLNPNALTPKQKEELTNYYAFRSDTIDNLNQYIKEITGAAMSIPEAERIMQAMPTAGQGLLDGDSPTQFMAKLNASLQRLTLVNARMNYARKVGQPWESIPIEQMERILQGRTDQLQEMYQKQGLQGDELRGAVRQGLKQEFGI